MVTPGSEGSSVLHSAPTLSLAPKPQTSSEMPAYVSLSASTTSSHDVTHIASQPLPVPSGAETLSQVPPPFQLAILSPVVFEPSVYTKRSGSNEAPGAAPPSLPLIALGLMV